MASILIFGLDLKLLETRKWILEAQHHLVFTASSLDEFPLPPACVDLMILCHTLSPDACALALDATSLRWPGARHLNLVGLGNKRPPCARNGIIVSALDGPAALIAAVRHLLSGPPVPSS